MEISLEEFTTQIFNKQTTPTASSSHLNEGTASFIDVHLSRGQAEGLGVVVPRIKVGHYPESYTFTPK